MRTRILLSSLFFCFFFFISTGNLISQTIFTENFEAVFPPSGWTLINAGTGSPWQENTNPAYSFSGQKSMQCQSVGNVARNAWAITQNLSLNAGIYYRISYWYREALPGRIEKMKVTLGNSATIAAQTTILHDYTDIENLNNVEGSDIFSVPANGNYNIGFYCYSSANTTAILLIDSIMLQQLGPLNCSGMPVAGAAAGPSSACSGANFTLNLSGTYVSGGQTLQWQSSPPAANTFTDIAGANSQSYTASQTTATDYRCKITCSNGGASVLSNVFTVAINNLCYCIPVVSSCGLGYIGNVKIGSINNNSTCNGGGYSNYAGFVTPADLIIGSTVPVTITPGGIAIAQSVAVWIDYNRNGLFEVSEYKDLGGGSSPLSGTINIPANALLGLTTMRIKSKGGSTVTSSASCLVNTDGETEDYLVNISPLPVCSGAVTGGTTNTAVGSICPDVSFVLKVSGASSGNSGFTFQWQKSPNNTAWTDVSGGSADSLITSQNTATYYRRKITCTGSGLSSFSSSIQIGINAYTACYCIPGNSTCSGTIVVRIDSVGFNTLHNVSGCDGVNGYSDYTGTIAATTVQAGTYVPITVKLNSSTLTRYLAVGIDFNHNGIFDASETTYGSGTIYFNLNIRIPFNAITGPVKMRVRSSYYDANPGFCYMQSYGEAEDYLVNVTAASAPGPNFSFYVNPLATGNGNGLTWTNAFTNLTNALNAVYPSDTIRVAKATYNIPSVYPYYFDIKDSVILWGGYPSAGNPGDALRNFRTNQTILSGIGAISILQGGNAFTLDGFLLQGIYGYPNGKNALKLTNSSGAKISHCVFRNNVSVSNGSGTAMRIINSSPVVSDCFFISNADAYGAIVLNESNSAAVFANCVFSKNISGGSVIENKQSTTSIINCDFVSNRMDTGTTVLAKNNSILNIKNSIFFNNEMLIDNGTGGYSIDSADIRLVNSTASISNTITQAYDYGNALLLSKDPKFRDSSNIAGLDNLYFTSDDGLQLNNPCSPAMNAGSNASAAGITSDILGNSRIFASIVDIGAYEVQSVALNIPTTLYVNKLAVGNGSGLSWANAITDLQAVMQSCSDTIRVAAGTYYPSNTDEKKSIWLQNKRVILGGYPNTGSPTDTQRNPSTNITIISGDLPDGNGKRSDVLLRGRTVDSTSITDGLVIKGAEGNFGGAMGAIYLTNKTNPVFRNCTISDNLSNGRGAALVNTTSSNPTFLNSIFENNSLTNIGEGGAVANLNSNPVFKKCTFRNNSNYIAGVSPSSGGAVYNLGSNAVFDSCIFLKNIGNNWAGAMDNVNSNPIISNCQFLGNMIAAGNANDINNNHSSPVVSNTFFSDSSGCNYGGSVVNLNQSNPTFIKCEFKNGRASYAGGASYNDNSSPVFVNCLFNGTVAGDGGVLNNQNGSNPVMVNCIATGNNASGNGSFMYNNNSNPVIKNTTIVNGTLPSTGNSFRGGVIVNAGTTQVTISNSIIWGNTVTSGQNFPNGDIIDYTNAASPTIMNNCISQVFGTTGVSGNLVNVDPLFLNIANAAGADNTFYTNDDGLRLSTCSPAVNAGLNASIAGYNTDILNNPRLYNSTVDMGAYEIQSIPGLITNTWTGTANGSWENPLNWSLGVLPNPCTQVIINSGTVLLSSNAIIYNITMATGANFTVQSGYNLTILH